MQPNMTVVFHQGREADHSPPSSAEVKEWLELYLHSPIRFKAWCLAKRRDNFFYLYLTQVLNSKTERENYTYRLHVVKVMVHSVGGNPYHM
jgi:hypothetical protein